MSQPKRFIVNVPTNRTKVVAIRSLSDPSIVAHGTKSSTVYRKVAHEKAASFRPVVLHVPQKDKTYIY